MKGSLKLVTIKGVSIFVHWSFSLLLAWLLIGNAWTGMKPANIFWSTLFLAAVFVSIILHELGHAIVAGQFGISAKRIILLPVGGIASIDRLPQSSKQEIAISFAGPLVNILIAGSLSLFVTVERPFVEVYSGLVGSGNFLQALFLVNIGLVVFNLVPAFPLDGGRILRALLGIRFNYVHATVIAATTGRIIAWALIFSGIAILNPFLILIGTFIILFAGMEEQYFRIKTLLKGIKVKDVLMYEYNHLDGSRTVKDAANTLMYNQSKYFMVMDGPTPVGSINRIEVIKAIADKKYDVRIRDLMKENLRFFDADQPVEFVIDKLADHEEKIYPVLDKNRFAGVISFQHLVEHMLINKVGSEEYGKMKAFAGLL